MPIFGAKSRAARGCASKLACGRRIDPHDTRPFLTIRCGKFAIAPRADRVVRPYKMFYVFAENAYNFAIAHCRGERGIDPYGRIVFSPHVVRFCNCIPHGRGRTPPLRSRGRFCGFALVRSDLQLPTAQPFRHGFAVTPPFTQGRLWVVLCKNREGLLPFPVFLLL